VLLIPVLDLSGGAAVHARGGDRARYRPVRSALVPDRPGDARALARAYRERLGAVACYVADLDAIEGEPLQDALLRSLATPDEGFGPGLLVDAAVMDEEAARAILALGVARVAVGLETLPSLVTLRKIVDVVGSERVVFSLDLREGRPLVRAAGCAGIPSFATPLEISRAVAGCGVRSLLVLDLARVGASGGMDLGLLADLRHAHPDAELLAGGGVRGRSDLQRLAEVGCDGALTATALHTGVLTAADLRTVSFAAPTVRPPLPPSA
jgi:phosphoribosylformimino-5-aminoimidazole carboxamide ribotide isomerase